MARKKDKTQQREIARERIARLFYMAKIFYKDNPSLSDNCVKHARVISMKHRIRIPKPYNRQYCRNCYRFLVPGDNLKVRIHRKKVIMTCSKCGYMRRYPILEKKEK
ncbi:ribonuclease P [Methanoplanus sp. FWC-SCC4]|uniref:Ribonuclease P protein component 4 n=1 Tax=Methanochimaera problematica TaxID=2609417 RepID=A0AA97FCM5_9EURY|nr:ribonuclease P [Methanoplanus sp. FWC-SCC4]WOF15768.1 ribonuclease P [Methanoplanus sp. FWC-SCC4]